MRYARFLSIAVLVTAASLLMAQTPAPRANETAPAAGNAANGKKIYAAYGCYQCHGYEGQGGGVAGVRLAPRPIALPAFISYVRAPKNQMPPYTSKVVTDQELADMYAFLLTVPPPPAVSSIPLLSN